MGKSTSCFKIITCGSDSADKDDLESKASSDKRGWSFRKRSARHRVLSNTVILETSPSGNKESPESASLNYQPPAYATAPEKIPVIQFTDEKHHLSTSVNPKALESIIAAENESKVDVNPEESVVKVDVNPEESVVKVDVNPEESVVKVDVNPEESVVITIQAAIRGFLGRRELLKLKNVVKLQAFVRGHLVRSHAVGTLRCVQAIIKMQGLVRTRRARLSLEGSYTEKELDGKHDKNNDSSKTGEKENLVSKSNVTYTSIEKLLGNRFARQLMESTPKSKPIHVKCDSSKPDSAWIWLERWMSVSSVDTAESKKAELMAEQQEREKNENFVSQVETIIPSEVFCESQNSKSSNSESLLPSESEENLITYDASNFNFQTCHRTSSSLGDDLEQPQPDKTSTSDMKETTLEIISLPNQTTQSEENSQTELNSLHRKPEMEIEQLNRSMKRVASEQLETEGKKFVFGSRKVSNPSFIAAHSKFEELSSIANSGSSISSPHQDAGVESYSEIISSEADTVIRTKELGTAENSVPHSSRVQIGGSECGTELSISSTLDSPDLFEVGATECENEAKVLEEGIFNPNSTKNLDVEAKDASAIPASNLSPPVLDHPEKLDDVNGESVTVVVAMDTPQVEPKPENKEFDMQRQLVEPKPENKEFDIQRQLVEPKPENKAFDMQRQLVEPKPENKAFDMQRQLDSETGHQPYRSSPEASPRSHITVPDSQGTPSSQVSVKAKKSKTDKSESNQKRTLSGVKKSPSNPNHDSGSRSGMEQLPKDQKTGKRRNSFGSPRPDHIDQEPRDSSTNSSIPHFMQATESARAKLLANSSPRSSPDVQDRDNYIKKRHSLPGANGRQGSPRIERSMSQAQQNAKGNGTIQHERKWQR